MTTYEILLLLDPEQAEARQDEIVARARELVEKGGGTWRSHDAWGRRRLAYPIAKKEEGVYHLVVFDAERGDARRGLPRPEDRRRRAAPPGDPAHRRLAHERAARRDAGVRRRPRTTAQAPDDGAVPADEPERRLTRDHDVSERSRSTLRRRSRASTGEEEEE